jgi:poly(A) polymerase Pap1
MNFIRYPEPSKKKQSQISDASLKDQKESGQEVASWTKFFKRYRFFCKNFKNFVRVDIVANSVNGSNENYLEWLGFVESKLYILLNLIGKEEHIQEIRAFP